MVKKLLPINRKEKNSRNSLKNSLFFLLIVFSAMPSIAQKPSLPKTLLWEITGNGLKKPSYVFGTMHLLCKDDAVMGDSLEFAINECKSVYFELDLDDMLQMFGMLKHLNMQNDLSLDQLVGNEVYRNIESFIKKVKLPIPFSMVRKMKPMLVAGLLSESLFDCSQKNGMEELIMKFAKQKRKTIHGLETIAYQAGLFDSIPYHDQAKELIKMVDNVEAMKLNTYKMVSYYKDQDLENLRLLTTETEPGMEQYMDLLLYNRNRNWASKFDQLAQNESCLIAVGAGHLPGNDGLLELLKKKGYEVRPITNIKGKGAMVKPAP